MSDHAHAGDAHGHAHAHGAHADHHAVYEGTPANEPGPDEPVTPGWLTLLGITLVLGAMLAFVVTRPDGKTRAELASSAGSAAPAAATATAAPQAAARPIPSGARPGLLPSDILRKAQDAQQRPAQPGQFAVQPGRPTGAERPARPSAPQ